MAMNLMAYFSSSVKWRYAEHCSDASGRQTACIFPTEIMKRSRHVSCRLRRNRKLFREIPMLASDLLFAPKTLFIETIKRLIECVSSLIQISISNCY